MLKSLRAALVPMGGLSTLVALGAIAWGLGRLQSLAEERQVTLDRLEAATTLGQEAYQEAAQRLRDLPLTYFDDRGRQRWLADGSFVAEEEPDTPDPSPADARAAYHADEVPS